MRVLRNRFTIIDTIDVELGGPIADSMSQPLQLVNGERSTTNRTRDVLTGPEERRAV
jgi:hypothetical protein